MPDEVSFDVLWIDTSRINLRNNSVLVINDLDFIAELLLDRTHPVCMKRRRCYWVTSKHRRKSEPEGFLDKRGVWGFRFSTPRRGGDGIIVTGRIGRMAAWRISIWMMVAVHHGRLVLVQNLHDSLVKIT